VIKQLGSKLKLKPRNLPKEISPTDWDPNDTTIALEKLVLAKNYEALKRRFDEANKMHMMAVEKMNNSHQLALKEKTTDIEELRKRNLDLQKRFYTCSLRDGSKFTNYFCNIDWMTQKVVLWRRGCCKCGAWKRILQQQSYPGMQS